MNTVPSDSGRSATVARIMQAIASTHGRAMDSLVRGFTSRWLEVFPEARFSQSQYSEDGQWWQSRLSMPTVLLRGFTDFVFAIASGTPSPEHLSSIAGKTAFIVLPTRREEESCRRHPRQPPLGFGHWR